MIITIVTIEDSSYYAVPISCRAPGATISVYAVVQVDDPTVIGILVKDKNDENIGFRRKASLDVEWISHFVLDADIIYSYPLRLMNDWPMAVLTSQTMIPIDVNIEPYDYFQTALLMFDTYWTRMVDAIDPQETE